VSILSDSVSPWGTNWGCIADFGENVFVIKYLVGGTGGAVRPTNVFDCPWPSENVLTAAAFLSRSIFCCPPAYRADRNRIRSVRPAISITARAAWRCWLRSCLVVRERRSPAGPFSSLRKPVGATACPPASSMSNAYSNLRGGDMPSHHKDGQRTGLNKRSTMSSDRT
jgi:hypothetical protein